MLADLMITKEILDFDEWNEQRIRERSKEISNTIIKMWNLF